MAGADSLNPRPFMYASVANKVQINEVCNTECTSQNLADTRQEAYT